MSKRSPQKKSKSTEKQIPAKQNFKKTAALFFDPLSESENALWHKFFLGSLILIFFLMIFLSLGSGINGDDYFQDTYSEQLLNWYASAGKDTSCFYHPRGPIQHYGGMYEIIAGATNRILGLEMTDVAYHDVRHIWNAIFGFLAIFFVGLYSRKSFGTLAGLTAIWVLFLSPRFLGHSLMNPKDIPFAAGYAMGLYFIYKLLYELPKPQKSTLLGLVIGVAIGFGIRAGGLILAGYAGIFVSLVFLLSYGFRGLSNIGLVFDYFKFSALPIIAGLILGLLFWPYALVSPFKHVPEALASLSGYGINIRMLFNSEMIFAKDVPAYYSSLWMFYTIPLFSLLGVLLFIIFFKTISRKSPIGVYLALFAFLFPLLYVILKKSPMYDGWRHMIFPYIALVILIAYGISTLFEKVKNKKAILYSIATVLAIMAIEPAFFIVKNASFPYTYFNPLIGGVKGALGKFETDYWGVSTRKAVDWLEKQNILNENTQDTITISSDFNYSLERYLNKKYKGKVKVRYVKYRQRYDQKWDYGIFTSRFLDGAHLRNGTWPPKSIIHSVEAGGVPICIIMKDEGHVAYEAQKALKSQNYEEAIRLLEQSIQQDEYNELSLIGLADATMAVGDFVKAENAIKAHDKVVPESYITQNLTGLLSIRQNKIDQAITAFKNAVRLQEDNGTGYYYLAYIYFNQKNNQEAISNIKKAVEVSPKFKAAYDLAAQIFEQAGDPGMAKAYRDAAQKI